MNQVLELPFVTTIKPNGHVTVPESIRNVMSIGPNDALLFTVKKVKFNTVTTKEDGE